METIQSEQKDVVKALYEYTAQLLIDQKKSKKEVEQILVDKGIDVESARVLIQTISEQIRNAKKESANKDMLYGALWCIGGTVATLADIGFIFWGAIVFGAIQFFKGVANL